MPLFEELAFRHHKHLRALPTAKNCLPRTFYDGAEFKEVQHTVEFTWFDRDFTYSRTNLFTQHSLPSRLVLGTDFFLTGYTIHSLSKNEWVRCTNVRFSSVLDFPFPPHELARSIEEPVASTSDVCDGRTCDTQKQSRSKCTTKVGRTGAVL